MANLLPDTSPEVTTIQTSTAQDLPYLKTWRFDFESGDFVSTSKNSMVSGVASYAEWAKTALSVQRYRYIIHSRSYGQEYEDLIGRDLTQEAIESEIERMTKECLMINPRTAQVGDFSFEWQEDSVYFTCTATTTLGEQVPLNGEVNL